MSLPPISYKRHRFPPQIIAHAVWLYFRFPLSLRLVEEMRVLRRMECPHRRTKAHYLNCHTGLGIGHSLMPLVLGFHEPRNHPHVLHYPVVTSLRMTDGAAAGVVEIRLA